VGGQAAYELGGSVGAQHRTHGEAEVPDDPAASHEHERACRVHLLGGQRVAVEPVVEVVVAAVEPAEIVVLVEALQPHRRAAHHSGSFGFLSNSSTSSGTGLAGLSSSAMNRSNASFDCTRSW